MKDDDVAVVQVVGDAFGRCDLAMSVPVGAKG